MPSSRKDKLNKKLQKTDILRGGICKYMRSIGIRFFYADLDLGEQFPQGLDAWIITP